MITTPKPQEPKTTKPDGLPDRFWNDADGAVRMDALLKSYQALEQRLSSKAADMPQKPDVPSAPDDYVINLATDILERDEALNARLHAKGFTNEQVQEVYDIAAERLVPLIADIVADMAADRELEKIVAHFGGPERWARMSKQLLAYGRKNMTPDVLASLTKSFEGVKMLHNMMTGGASLMPADIGYASGKNTLSLDDATLSKMMQDPKYWRDRDSTHIAKVTEGFQELYGNS